MPYAPEYEAVHARWYDPAYAHRTGDAAFYRELARETGGPVLELGCGTGRVLLPIACDGIPCVGLDSAPAMLDVLRARSRRRPCAPCSRRCRSSISTASASG